MNDLTEWFEGLPFDSVLTETDLGGMKFWFEGVPYVRPHEEGAEPAGGGVNVLGGGRGVII